MAIQQNLLPMNELRLDLFHIYHGEAGYDVLYAEASTVGYKKMERIFNDACDEGIAIRSRTGRVERFYFSREDRDREGDIHRWIFYPVSVGCAVKEVRIFND